MAGLTPTDAERAELDAANTTPENQTAMFRYQDQVWPVRVIRRGAVVRPLPPHAPLSRGSDL